VTSNREQIRVSATKRPSTPRPAMSPPASQMTKLDPSTSVMVAGGTGALSSLNVHGSVVLGSAGAGVPGESHKGLLPRRHAETPPVRRETMRSRDASARTERALGARRGAGDLSPQVHRIAASALVGWARRTRSFFSVRASSRRYSTACRMRQPADGVLVEPRPLPDFAHVLRAPDRRGVRPVSQARGRSPAPEAPRAHRLTTGRRRPSSPAPASPSRRAGRLRCVSRRSSGDRTGPRTARCDRRRTGSRPRAAPSRLP
jgi:hypothetical protein